MKKFIYFLVVIGLISCKKEPIKEPNPEVIVTIKTFFNKNYHNIYDVKGYPITPSIIKTNIEWYNDSEYNKTYTYNCNYGDSLVFTKFTVGLKQDSAGNVRYDAIAFNAIYREYFNPENDNPTTISGGLNISPLIATYKLKSK